MQALSEPGDDLVTRTLAKVDFHQRLVGYRYRQRAGLLRVPLYGFEEVVHLLNDKYPQISLKQLEDWVRTVIDDAQLADQIAQVVGQDATDRERMFQIRLLMGERLCQCRKAVTTA